MKIIAKKEMLAVQAIPQTVETKSMETLWLLETGAQKSLFKEVIVKTGITDGRFTQIVEGISNNDKIVTEALDPTRENPVLLMGKMKV